MSIYVSYGYYITKTFRWEYDRYVWITIKLNRILFRLFFNFGFFKILENLEKKKFQLFFEAAV